jgi:hypothetical protein
MKKYIGIFTTDQINKYGYKFSVEAIEDALRQSWKIGTPMFISHDYHRPIGFSKPFGLNIQSKLVSLLGKSYIKQDDNDQDIINEYIKDFFLKKIYAVADDEKNELLNRLNGYLSGNEIFMKRECTCVIDVDIAKKVLPHIFIGEESDKRALTSIKDLHQIEPGVFEIDGYTVFAHRFYRRSLSNINNLNDIFLSKLYELKNKENLDVKILLDPNTLGLAGTYRKPIELEYWWGPKFNESLLEIPSGVTCHNASDRQKEFHGILRTEFWWHKQNDIQSLECEEIRDIPTPGIGNDKYGCRYIHSMINNNTGLPNHLDGAIRIYTEEHFIERLDLDISKAGKNTEYFKLWRLDGDIEISVWKDLICHFYRDNHLPGEYLNGEEELEDDDSQDNGSLHEIQATHSHKMQEDGVNILISYHAKEKYFSNNEINIDSKTLTLMNDEKIKCIELTALDLIKLIRKKTNADVIIQNDVKYIAFEDMDINFPLLIFNGENAINNADQALLCLKELVSSFINNQDDRTVSACLIIDYVDFFVKFAFIGHIKVINDFFIKTTMSFPKTVGELGTWCASMHEVLKQYDSPLVDSIAILNNLDHFEIQREYVNPQWVHTSNDYKLELRIPENEFDINVLRDDKISIVPVSIIESTVCSACEKDYLECTCSCFLDKNCNLNISGANLIGFVWATNHA